MTTQNEMNAIPEYGYKFLKSNLKTVNRNNYIHRDISWMSFNARVLQESKDSRNPLLERLKFLGIYSKNLAEFYKVRMASHLNLIRVNKKMKKRLEYSPKKLIKKLISITNQQQSEFTRIYNDEIIPELASQGVFIKTESQLDIQQEKFVDNFYSTYLCVHAHPLLMRGKKITPFLKNDSLYLAIVLRDKEKLEGPKEYGLLRIPTDFINRYVLLPSPPKEHHVILLDDVIRFTIYHLFPGYNIEGAFSFKLTRDAELYLDNEFSGSLKDKIRKSLIKRQVGPPSRFVYDRNMPQDLLSYLVQTFKLNKYDLIREGKYQNNFDLLSFPDFGKTHLLNNTLHPLPFNQFSDSASLFRSISRKSHLIHPPYHSYETVIRFFEYAAFDPQVTTIKITQYRVSRNSRIMNALIQAAKNGKKTTVFVEVQARFDEQSNIDWGEKLEAAGVNVIYSIPGIKVHSKISLVVRNENGKEKSYSFLSTGNFHEGNAKVYCDIGLFTSHLGIVKDVYTIFDYLEGKIKRPIIFNHLLVGKFNLRESLLGLIDDEISIANKGGVAKITLKMNSLQDKIMIDKLYEASLAGVQIVLIIRGICCLDPNLKNHRKQIRIISIVDRYLEHARIYRFHNGGSTKLYLSSADWMLRNLSKRIETAFPIYDHLLKQEIDDLLDFQTNDNVKARIINSKQNNKYVKQGELKIQSQLESYKYLHELNKVLTLT